MKSILLTVFTLATILEASAQHDRRDGRREVREARRDVREVRRDVRDVRREVRHDHREVRRDHRDYHREVRHDHRDHRRDVHHHYRQPRRIYNSHSHRAYRAARRPVIVWNQPFTYGCTARAVLMYGNHVLRNFYSFPQCKQAIQDIRMFGDFCYGADMIDQSGVLEAQFDSEYECREALPFYY